MAKKTTLSELLEPMNEDPSLGERDLYEQLKEQFGKLDYEPLSGEAKLELQKAGKAWAKLIERRLKGHDVTRAQAHLKAQVMNWSFDGYAQARKVLREALFLLGGVLRKVLTL